MALPSLLPQSYSPFQQAEKEEKQRIDFEQRKANCISKGGSWDDEKKICILPPKDLNQRGGGLNLADRQELADIRSKEAGIEPRLLETDSSFSERKPRELQLIAEEDAAKIAAEEAKRKLALAAQVGQIDFETARQLDELGINWREAILAGSSEIVPTALTGAAGLAVVGAAATAPAGGAGAIPGAIIGAAGGAITGFYKGVESNIQAQKGDLISGQAKILKKRQKAMLNYISAANANPAAAEEMMLAFNNEKTLIRKDFNTLNKEANEDLSYFGGQDGTPQIIEYNIFFDSVLPSLEIRMEQAILKPDPTRAFLSIEDLE